MVITKFKNRDLKNAIYALRWTLKNTDISITEHLTPHTRALISKVKAAFPRNQVFTEDCKVYIKWGKSKRYVRDSEGLAKLAERFNDAETVPKIPYPPRWS